jgi:DHA1 family multidrug resistance protein-like MFS transporter
MAATTHNAHADTVLKSPRDSLVSNESQKDVEKQANLDEENQEGSGAAPLHSQEEKEKDPHLIEWDKNDPENPFNWPQGRRWLYTVMLGLVTFVVTFASSVFSAATEVTAQEFGVSEEVATLGTSLFVLGFAFGPIVWGPFSEVYGRKLPLYTGYFIFAVFNIGVAVAQNLYTIMVRLTRFNWNKLILTSEKLCRFFGGLFASAPLAVIGGHVADMWVSHLPSYSYFPIS